MFQIRSAKISLQEPGTWPDSYKENLAWLAAQIFQPLRNA